MQVDLSATAGFKALVKNGGNKPFQGKNVFDLHLVYTFYFGDYHTSERENQRYDKNTVCLLGQDMQMNTESA
ncbi:MAG: hypothetical protein IK138_09240 [Lachnospiraceae bacterium]|nr:hypothetical protein [Lachnospiraceae bacterium]